MNIEKIRKCPICSKELPIEARFCPYCMTKLIDENNTAIDIKTNNNMKKVLWIITIILVFVILTEVGVMYGIRKTNRANDNRKAKTQKVDEQNYENYLGVWYSEGVNDIHKDGGNKVEICKVDGNVIVFCVENISKGFSKVATVEYMRVELIKGEGNFSFTDDGKGNSGIGIIRLNNNKVYVRINLNNESKTTDWDIVMDTNFTQVEKFSSNETVNINDFLGCYYEDIKGKLGERTDITEYGDTIEYEYENGVTLKLVYDPVSQNYNVIGIYVSYDNFNGKYKVTYEGIDNTFNKQDIRDKFSGMKGDDSFTKGNYMDMYLNGENLNTTKFYYDKDNKVTEIELY